jgi:hypothetical protein
MQPTRLFIIGALLTSTVTCAAPGANVIPPTESTASTDAGNAGSTNWDEPFESSTRVSSFDEADSYLGFRSPRPAGLGEPNAIFVSAAPESERAAKALGLVYDTQSYGRIVMTAKPLGVSPETRMHTYQSLASKGVPTSSGVMELVSISDTIQGLYVRSGAGDINGLRFPLGVIEIKIGGPAVTRDQLIGLARQAFLA